MNLSHISLIFGVTFSHALYHAIRPNARHGATPLAIPLALNNDCRPHVRVPFQPSNRCVVSSAPYNFVEATAAYHS